MGESEINTLNQLIRGKTLHQRFYFMTQNVLYILSQRKVLYYHYV